MSEEAKGSSVPAWAIEDADALNLIPDTGFIKEYLEYLRTCTDAPVIYHYGTIMTVLSVACSGADILCRYPTGSRFLPTPLWSVLVGDSGSSRKSSSMSAGVDMLERAKSIMPNPEVLLPADGSLEAWHEFLVENEQALLYRDELAVLFDQSKRNYSDGLKHWLMELYTGRPRTRVTLKGKATGKPSTIQRPRLGILGAIPPDTFSKKAHNSDWLSGFLARFTFWPGDREWWMRYPRTDLKTETELVKWINKVACKRTGYIEIDEEANNHIADWVYHEVEKPRKHLSSEMYSHLVRYQDLALRLAAMHAVARCTTAKEAPKVIDEDIDITLTALDLLKQSIGVLFPLTQKNTETQEEDRILELLARSPKKALKRADLQKKLPELSRAKLGKILKTLAEGGDIKRAKLPPKQGKTGRPAWGYFL